MKRAGQLLLLLPLAWAALAEQTIAEKDEPCGGAHMTGSPRPSSPWEPRSFTVQDSGFCSQYANKGWDDTMTLYLGEGHEEHANWIRMAVDLWNAALGATAKPLIEISDSRPRNYMLPAGLSFDSQDELRRLRNDGQSVIYFRPFADEQFSGWYSYRSESSGMQEVDMYIDTEYFEEYGPLRYLMSEVYVHSETQAVFSRVNSIYLTIVHEIGHALGLSHIPIAGNAMSYRRGKIMVDIWQPVYSLAFLVNPRDSDLERMLDAREGRTDGNSAHARPEQTFRREQMEFYTRSYRLGEQDLAALMCIYDFDAWK